jgi:anoctamin-10
MLTFFHLHSREDSNNLSSIIIKETEETEMESAKVEKRFTRQYLHTNWVKRFDRQPISAIREYLGEKVALYFAYCGLYTNWLMFPSAAGVIVTVYGFTRLALYVLRYS